MFSARTSLGPTFYNIPINPEKPCVLVDAGGEYGAFTCTSPLRSPISLQSNLNI